MDGSCPRDMGLLESPRIDECSDITARIPDELLSQIFLDSLPPDLPPAMVIYESPLLLTHVCRRWRSLACAIPELWTSVHLLLAYFRPGALDNMNTCDEEEVEREAADKEWMEEEEECPMSAEDRILAEEDKARLPFIQTWFSRTRSTDSLHLSLSDELIFSNPSSPITDFVVTLLDRVESLDLMLCRRTLPRFTEFQPRAYERLRKLRFSGDGFDPEEWAFLHYDAPLLEAFDIRALRSPVTSLPLNWSGLTRLTVSYFNDPQDVPTIDVLKEVLRATRKLRSLRMVVTGELEVEGQAVRQQEQKADRRIELPELHTLELEFSYSIKALFDSLALPSLSQIQLVEDRSRRYPPVPPTPSKALLNLLLSQRPLRNVKEVRKIEIEAVYYPKTTIIECLTMVPGLECLILLAPPSNSHRRTFELADEQLGFDDDVLDVLTHTPGLGASSTSSPATFTSSLTSTWTSGSTLTQTSTFTCTRSGTAADGGDEDGTEATMTGPLCPDLEQLEVLDSRYDWPGHPNRSPGKMAAFLLSRLSASRQRDSSSRLKVVIPESWIPSTADFGGSEFRSAAVREGLEVRVSGKGAWGDEGDDEGDDTGGCWLRQGYWSEAWYQA